MFFPYKYPKFNFSRTIPSAEFRISSPNSSDGAKDSNVLLIPIPNKLNILISFGNYGPSRHI